MAITCASGTGRVAVSVPMAATGVKLWWPRGMGAQAMYSVNVTFTPDAAVRADSSATAAATLVTATRRIGFRVATLTTGNDTDSGWVAAHSSANANGNAVPAHTVMIRINGAAVSARGANMIPMETLEGRYVEVNTMPIPVRPSHRALPHTSAAVSPAAPARPSS